MPMEQSGPTAMVTGAPPSHRHGPTTWKSAEFSKPGRVEMTKAEWKKAKTEQSVRKQSSGSNHSDIPIIDNHPSLEVVRIMSDDEGADVYYTTDGYKMRGSDLGSKQSGSD